MAHLSLLAGGGQPTGFAQGRPRQRYTITTRNSAPGRLLQDPRVVIAMSGGIADQVILKIGPVETPFANGRVWLLRAADGYKAWEGWSDAAGNYSATGLELGVEYVAVAIDPTRQHKTTAAGPVASVLPTP